jgi:hypothetical protein
MQDLLSPRPSTTSWLTRTHSLMITLLRPRCDRRLSGNDVFRLNQGPVAMHAAGGTPRALARLPHRLRILSPEPWKPASTLCPSRYPPQSAQRTQTKVADIHLAPLCALQVIDSLHAHGSAMLPGVQGPDEPTSRDGGLRLAFRSNDTVRERFRVQVAR